MRTLLVISNWLQMVALIHWKATHSCTHSTRTMKSIILSKLCSHPQWIVQDVPRLNFHYAVCTSTNNYREATMRYKRNVG